MATNPGLAALLAKQKAKANAPTSVADSHDSEGTTRVSAGEHESDSVPREAESTPTEAQRSANPFGKRKDSGTEDRAEPTGSGTAPASGVDSSGEQPRPKLASLNLKPESQLSDSPASGVAAPAIDSLDALDQSEDEGIAPRQSMSHFSDETPASKPTRDLPPDLDRDALGFMDMVDGVYDVMHEPELLGSVIRNIIIELKSHPEYMKLVAPDDIRSWVRGMRESMGLAKIRKTESKSKRSGGAGKKSKLVDADMLADLADLGVDIPE